MDTLWEHYEKTLQQHLSRPAENYLFEAYAMGRQCAKQGLQMSELVNMHFNILRSGRLRITDATLPDSQAFLLEAALAMSISNGMKTMEPVLAALYDETIEQFKELRTLKEELQGYSQNLEEKVQEKLAELQASEERFQVLIQTIPDIVYKIDSGGAFVYVNEAVRQLGYEPMELIGKHFSTIILPSEVDLVSSSFILPRYAGRTTGDQDAPKLFDERRSGSRRTTGLEVRLLLKSGKVIPGMVEPLGREVLVVEVSSSGIHQLNPRTRKKEHIGTVGVIRDITERKRQEAELRRYHQELEGMVEERTLELAKANAALQAEIGERKRSEEFVQNILESLTEALVVVDPDYRIIAANKTYAEQVKIPVADLIGRRCFEIRHQFEHPCHEDGMDCGLEKTMRSGKHQVLYKDRVDSQGQKFQSEIKTYPMNEGGRTTSVIAIIYDVTEKKRLEDQLRQAQKMEAIGTLAGGIAHDFNNILAAIIGYAELARTAIPADSEADHDLKESLKAANRARELVKQILTFSRQTEQALKPLLLVPIVKEGLKLLRASLPSTIELRQHIEEGLGAVLADPTQIHQVLINLCTNAAQAMSENQGEIEVRLEREKIERRRAARHPDLHPGPYLRLTVRDSGTGMKAELLKRIFEPYFTTKEKDKGTGLGLSVVHGIVKAHGGAVTVESAPGKGSSFMVFLPEVQGAALSEEDQSAPPLSGNESILLVDDEEDLVFAMTKMLARLGYQVTSRTDSTEALELFRQSPEQFDLLITDMTMPNLTGDRLAREVLKIRPHFPIVLCTGYSELISSSTAKELGIREFATKPLDLIELASLIRSALDKGPPG